MNVTPFERHIISDRQEWLARRRQDLTASDIGAAAGCSPHKTPLELYGQKKGWIPEPVENAAMQRGRLLEPVALQMLRERRPTWVVEQPNLYLRDAILRLGGTADAIATDVSEPKDIIVIEVKSMMESVFDRDWQDGPPLFVELQTLTNAMLWEAARAVVAALVIDRWANLDLYIFDVPRHAGAEKRIRDIAWEFWANFDNGIEPRADYKRDAAIVAELRKPVHREPPLDLSGDNELPAILEERATLLDEVRHRTDRLDEIRTELVDKMNGYQRAELPGWKISNIMTHRAEHLVRAADYAVLRVRRLT